MKQVRQQTKRKTKFTAYVASSIDGRISLSSKSMPDWTSKEDWDFFQSSLAKADAVVVGRNTFAAAAKSLRKRNTFVFSSRYKKMYRRGSVTFVNPAYVDLQKLFLNFKNVAIVGGGLVYGAMLDCGLMDEICITIEPLIFGRGKNMFECGGKQIKKFQLISVRKLNSTGTLLLHYKIEHVS